MHMLTTAITDGFAMLRNVLLLNPSHGNMGHQLQTVAMHSNSGNMQNVVMMQFPQYQAQSCGYRQGQMVNDNYYYRTAVEENDELQNL